MASSHHQFAADIRDTPGRLFDLLADMPNYGRWLPGSAAFGATTDVSPYPVCLGTTYLDAGPAGARRGVVTAYNRPTYLAFHQTMALKALRANIDIDASYTLEPFEHATRVTRDLDLAIDMPGVLKILEPLVVFTFRKENLRTLAKLKHYAETHPGESAALG